MNLKKLIKLIKEENRLDSSSEAHRIVADKIGLKESTIRSMSNGTRRITAEKAKALEKAFKGKIKACDLRPDIFT